MDLLAQFPKKVGSETGLKYECFICKVQIQVSKGED